MNYLKSKTQRGSNQMNQSQEKDYTGDESDNCQYLSNLIVFFIHNIEDICNNIDRLLYYHSVTFLSP